MSSCVSAVLISLACDKHLSPTQLKHKCSLHYITKAMHYYDEGYESNNDYGLPPGVMRPVQVYSAFTTEASYNPAKYMVTQCQIYPFTSR